MFGWPQEQVERSVQEKAELQRELDLIMAEKETLKSLLQKQQQEGISLKVCKANSAQSRSHLELFLNVQ